MSFSGITQLLPSAQGSVNPLVRAVLPNAMKWRGVWDVSGTYGYGDVVQDTNNAVWVADKASCGIDPATTSAPYWSAVGGASAGGGMDWRGAWSAGTYKSEDVVVDANGQVYLAKGATTAEPITDISGSNASANWQSMTGLTWRQGWDSNVQYGRNDVVSATEVDGGSGIFVALCPSLGKTPASNASLWTPLADLPGSAMSYSGAWSSSSNYNTQDVVSESGFAYVALQPSSSTSPQDPASAPSYWLPLSGAGSTPVIHYKAVNAIPTAFRNANAITASNWAGILTLPTGGLTNINGQLSLAGTFGNGGSNVNADNLFQVSDVSGVVASGLARFSETFTWTNQASGLTPINMDLNFSFSNLTGSNLYLNVMAGSNGFNAYSLATNTDYQYANVLTPTTYVADP